MQHLLLIHSPKTHGPLAKTYYQAHLVDYRYFKLYKLVNPLASKSLVVAPGERKVMAESFRRAGLFDHPSLWRTLLDWKKLANRQDLLPIVIPFDANDEHDGDHHPDQPTNLEMF